MHVVSSEFFPCKRAGMHTAIETNVHSWIVNFSNGKTVLNDYNNMVLVVLLPNGPFMIL